MLRGIAAAVRQPRVLAQTDHRPWPVPDRRWLMAQTWSDLLFAHWRVDAADLRPVVHPDLPIDVRDGSAWVGVTPFRVEGFRPRFTPPLPLLHAFPELNVRTYVTIDERPGIYFFSLDAGSRFAVEAARRIYRVPYFHARMRVRGRGGAVDFESERTQSDGPAARLAIHYEAAGPAFEPEPGSLEHFLTERYCLYTLDDRQRVLRGDIHHPPWRIRPATARLAENTMGEQVGLDLADAPLVHLAERQDVVFWTLRPLA
ncbi:MAG TPA: DUF2071 domain-containing protein [Thermoleophilaceae bacterium]|nr:DUF2071 domain-containing protein [Thermoleophilaceae bacterium]